MRRAAAPPSSFRGTKPKRRRRSAAVIIWLPVWPDASMRRELGSFVLLDRRLGLGGLNVGLVFPLDRIRHARERACQHLVHPGYRDDLETALDAVGNLHQ